MRRRLIATALIATIGLCGPADAQESRYRDIIGTWHGISGQENLEIRRTGDMLWSGGPMLRVAPTTREGANFVFEGTLQESGKPVSCLFYIDFLKKHDGVRTADWRRIGAHRTGCPQKGIYELQDAIGSVGGDDADIIYYKRDTDGSKVVNALHEAHIAFTKKDSDLPDPVNQIVCSKDASSDDLKSLARSLVDAGVRIRRIKAADGDDGRMRINSDVAAEGRSVIDHEQIDTIEGCADVAGKTIVPQHPRVSIEHECLSASSGADVYFYLYDEKLDQKTKVYEVDVDYHTRRLVNSSVRYLPESRNPWVYYYARGKNILGMTTEMPSDGTQTQNLPDGESVRFGRTRLRQGVLLNCN